MESLINNNSSLIVDGDTGNGKSTLTNMLKLYIE